MSKTNRGPSLESMAVQIEGEYFQAHDGSWWVLNPQRGLVPTHRGDRCLEWFLARHVARYGAKGIQL